MKYLISRLKEKSTITALIGLITVVLHHIPTIPTDIINAGSLLAIALFVGVGVSEG